MLLRAFGPLLCGGFLLLITPAEGAPGDPLPGADVLLEQSPGGVIKQVKTDSKGIANFGVVQPGTYTVRSGPQVIKIITITKTGPLRVPVTEGAAAVRPVPAPGGVGAAVGPAMPAIPVPAPGGGSHMVTVPR